MKRSPMVRTRFKKKPPSPAKAKAWRAVKAALWKRCEGRCEKPRCRSEAQDPHHVKKRSQGGSDELSNLVALCRSDHDATDYAHGRGRLEVFPVIEFVRRWDNSEHVLLRFHFWRDDTYLGSIGPFTEETPDA